jgi:3'-phosphoadenosine 5'-phosphosulfate sulfotransferase (PAPS reductase)/FAD synthetase
MGESAAALGRTLELFPVESGVGLGVADAPAIASYDWLLVNTSAGKDSQAMLDFVVREARKVGIEHRVVAVHADLGRVEWEGTRELAEIQAEAYGVRFVAIKRPQGDLLKQVEERGMWPSSTTRYCTSDHKRGQVAKVVTSLADEALARLGWPVGRKVRVLNCLGFRTEESPARRNCRVCKAKLPKMAGCPVCHGTGKRLAFERDARLSNGKREVDVWFPIHEWTVNDVWAAIRASGVPFHRAYRYGMPRLSCCYCIFASRAALVLAGTHNRELLDEYVALEERIGHSFRKDLPIAAIRAAVLAGETPDVAELQKGWCM